MNSSAASDSVPAARVSLWTWPLRVLRVMALLWLSTIIAALVIATAFTLFSPFAKDDPSTSSWAARVLLGAGVLLPILLMWFAARLRLRSWWWLAGGYLAVMPILVYLATDEPTLRRTNNIDEIAPAFPGAETSYTLLNRYQSDRSYSQELKAMVYLPKDQAQWTEFLATNRERIDTAWSELAAQRAWYEELNAHARLGDLGRAVIDAPLVAYQMHRALAVLHVERAGLLALDGRGDEAIALLIPVLEVNRKLIVHARTLVRSMVGLACRTVALDGVEFVLARTTVSPAMRAKLVSALGSPLGEAGARRLIGIEFAYWSTDSLSVFSFESYKGPRLLRPLVRGLTFVFLNPRRTVNAMGDYFAELQERAARRQPLPTSTDELISGGPFRVKNILGRYLMASGMPGFQKVVDGYWKQEDRLAALRAQIASD